MFNIILLLTLSNIAFGFKCPGVRFGPYHCDPDGPGKRWGEMQSHQQLASRTIVSIFDAITGVTPEAPDPLVGFGPLADSFTTPSIPTTISSVVLSLVETEAEPLGTFDVSILNDNAGSPGTTVGVIVAAAPDATVLFPPPVSFTPPAPIFLAPLTRYWIQVTATPTSNIGWLWGNMTLPANVATEFFSNINGVAPNLPHGPYLLRVLADGNFPTE